VLTHPPIPARLPALQRRCETQVLARLTELGFTSFLVRPRKTDQDGCAYPPPPPGPRQA
jgi:hypothetical protein